MNSTSTACLSLLSDYLMLVWYRPQIGLVLTGRFRSDPADLSDGLMKQFFSECYSLNSSEMFDWEYRHASLSSLCDEVDLDDFNY
jgi:hypothetical protein